MRTLAAVLALGMLASPALGDTFDEAVNAYNRGDFPTSLGMFRQLAVQGDPQAQFNVGLMYEDGKGVAPNYDSALKWYRVAAQQGNAGAQNNIGYMYCYGRGVEQDFREAMSWYRLSAEQNFPRAQFNIGLMYEEAMGVERDFEEARKWYRLAAERQDPSALFRLAAMHEEGRGGPVNTVQAHVLYGMSAAAFAVGSNRDLALKRREALAAKLSPEELGEAQRKLAEHSEAAPAFIPAKSEALPQ